jgi:hypothetical protein
MQQLVLSRADRAQLAARGTDPEQVRHQYHALTQGVHFVCLNRPCTLADGIVQIADSARLELAQRFRKAVAAGRCTLFVPASGAASRMFASLRRAAEHPGEETAAAGHDWPDDARFARALRHFAFYDELGRVIQRRGLDLAKLLAEADYAPVIRCLLDPDGLGYGSAPKALVQFHAYPDGSRTPLQEHLAEAAAYLRDTRGIARVHFTVAPEHAERIAEHIAAIRSKLRGRGLRFEVTTSCQSPSTDAIAVDGEGKVIRAEDGELLFRPAGHGALLHNLNALGADIVLLKNIDNVVVDALKPQRYVCKRMLGGYLLALQEQLFHYLEALAQPAVPASLVEEGFRFAAERLSITPATDPKGWPPSARIEYLRRKLDRPLRVCGVVANTGEPGGGPFWVIQPDGSTAPQIVESAQVNLQDERQCKAWKSSTHFNPVDIVCGLRNYRGECFDLPQYTAPHAYIITAKTVKGRETKVFELPGLWNGGMGDWNTAFVEVPAYTFTPVKTVFDLLRREHQGPGYATASFVCDIAFSQVITAIRDVHLSLAPRAPFPKRELAGVVGPSKGRLTPGEHLDLLVMQGRLRDLDSPLLVVSCRNVLSNLRCVGYVQGVTSNVVGVLEEDFSRSVRPYFVLGQKGDQHAGVCLQEVRPEDGLWRDFRWFVSGVPVLWDDWTADELFRTMVTEAADHAHIWRMPRGKHPEATELSRRQWQEMQDLFLEQLYAPRDEAFAKLLQLPFVAGLQREDAYVHHVLGTDDNGNLYEVIQRGRPEDIGHVLRSKGAKRAICVDNAGASVVQFYPEGARGPVIQRYAAPDHREAGTAFLFVELESSTFSYGEWG